MGQSLLSVDDVAFLVRISIHDSDPRCRKAAKAALDRLPLDRNGPRLPAGPLEATESAYKAAAVAEAVRERFFELAGFPALSVLAGLPDGEARRLLTDLLARLLVSRQSSAARAIAAKRLLNVQVALSRSGRRP